MAGNHGDGRGRVEVLGVNSSRGLHGGVVHLEWMELVMAESQRDREEELIYETEET